MYLKEKREGRRGKEGEGGEDGSRHGRGRQGCYTNTLSDVDVLVCMKGGRGGDLKVQFVLCLAEVIAEINSEVLFWWYRWFLFSLFALFLLLLCFFFVVWIP